MDTLDMTVLTSLTYLQDNFRPAEFFGWFSGDPLDLAPLSHKEKAERMVELVGWSGMLSAA